MLRQQDPAGAVETTGYVKAQDGGDGCARSFAMVDEGRTSTVTTGYPTWLAEAEDGQRRSRWKGPVKMELEVRRPT